MKKFAIASEIADKIKEGKYGESGNGFRSIRDIASEYGISPVTAKEVFDILRADGLIVRKGKGYYLYHKGVSKGSFLQGIKKKSGFIGVFVPGIQNLFFVLLAKNIQKYAEKSGYRTFITSESENFKFLDALEGFEVLGADAAVVVPSSAEKIEKTIKKPSYPLIFAAADIENEHYDKVIIDNRQAGKSAADLLYKGGYDKIVAIGLSRTNDDNPRISGFIARLGELGVLFGQDDFIKVKEGKDVAFIVNKLVKDNAGKTIGIFCYHDILANKVVEACRKNGYSVPDEVGVIGCDNLPLQDDKIKITTIAYSVQEMAEVAVAIAVARINGDESSPKARIVPFYVYKKNPIKNEI